MVYPLFLLPACRALAFTSAGGERPAGRGQYSPHSLVHCLVKLAQKASSGGSNIAVLRAVFSILATLTLSQECRGILWKVGWLIRISRHCVLKRQCRSKSICAGTKYCSKYPNMKMYTKHCSKSAHMVAQSLPMW